MNGTNLAERGQNLSELHVIEYLQNYTLPDLLDKLDVIECFEQPGERLRVGKNIEKIVLLYYVPGKPRPPRYEWAGI